MKTSLVWLISVCLCAVVTAAPTEFKNEKAITAKANAAAAQAKLAEIKQKPDYAVYTNIVKLLTEAKNWADAQPLLIKYITIKEGLDAVDAEYTGKKNALKAVTPDKVK